MLWDQLLAGQLLSSASKLLQKVGFTLDHQWGLKARFLSLPATVILGIFPLFWQQEWSANATSDAN